MVWKEQAVTVQAGPLVLEGIWQAGPGRGAVVAPPHPRFGGSIENPVVNEVAHGLFRSGYASLRFNWRGVGASQGDISSDPDAAAADYVAALDHVEATVGGPVIGAGYSFGAATALRVALETDRLRGLLLVAPPVAMIEDLEIGKFGHPLYVMIGADDEYAPIDRWSELLSCVERAQLEVILHTDHFFVSNGLADLARLVQGAQF